MNHTNFTALTWGKWRRSDVVPATVTVEVRVESDDSCEAAYVEELESEWLHALETADYSHLPKLNKIPA